MCESFDAGKIAFQHTHNKITSPDIKFLQRGAWKDLRNPENTRIDLVQPDLQAEFPIDDLQLNRPDIFAEDGVDFETYGVSPEVDEFGIGGKNVIGQ